MMMILCLFSLYSNDTLLARGGEKRKKNLSFSITLRREPFVGPKNYLGYKRSRKAVTCYPLALFRQKNYLSSLR